MAIRIAYALQQLYYGIYVQDDWRVMRNLTVNMGIRWDYETPFTERSYNRLNNGFCACLPEPAFAILSVGRVFTRSMAACSLQVRRTGMIIRPTRITFSQDLVWSTR